MPQRNKNQQLLMSQRKMGKSPASGEDRMERDSSNRQPQRSSDNREPDGADRQIALLCYLSVPPK